MTPLWFFLLGMPVALLAHRAIVLLSAPDAEEAEDEEAPSQGLAPTVKPLPWQTGDWPTRIQLLTAASAPPLMALAGWRFDLAPALGVSALVIALLVCTATDLIRFRVPNAITYPGTALAVVAALVLPGGDAISALIAAAVGGLVFLLMAIITRGGIGLGDVKLAVLIGAGLGLRSSYQALLLGVLAGGVIILGLFVVGIVSRRQAVPYAPFLALAAVAVVLVRGGAFATL